ncbi:hypothetical protein BJ508DRAFT_367459 [Ascobolus immersus RN42]|uniref:Uncharacterized protein n=1 Tax=Ascobolus immersus RN42 TaxID=1160509 RepID=A0A3N4HCI1_ASCIM|nr:hypothetical protein BJ508DRAFT_367459 [Ascobolus immersus RN42]
MVENIPIFSSPTPGTPTRRRRELELRHLTSPKIPRTSSGTIGTKERLVLASKQTATNELQAHSLFNGSMGCGFAEWLTSSRPKKAPQSQIAKRNSPLRKFHRPFERVCACDPALILILNKLSTPDIISLMWTSRTVSHFVCSQTGADVFKEIVMVRDERWPMLSGVHNRRRRRDLSWRFSGKPVDPWKPASQFFKEVIEWVAHYKEMDDIEKRVQWATDFRLQAERLSQADLLDRHSMEKLMALAQHDRLSELVDIAKWKLSDAEAYLEIEFPKHLYTVEPQKSNPFAAPLAALDCSAVEDAVAPDVMTAFFAKFNDFSFNSYFSRLRYPQNITRIILDGTSITNRGLSRILRAVERNLEFISTRSCRNISAKVYTDWLEDLTLAGEVIPLEEINTFGAAGLEGRYLSSHTLMNPLDYYRNGYSPPNFTKFGSCMPVTGHAKYTIPLLIPQHFSLEEKLFIYEWMLYQLQKDDIEWKEYCQMKGLDRKVHYFSGGLILHEIPEQTRLMAVCGFLGVDLDVNFCAGGKNCYSYQNSIVPKIINEDCAGPSISFPSGFRIPRNYYDLLNKWNDPHPFNLTQRYRRREEGGMPCRSCGHYENKRARDYPGTPLPRGRWMELVHSFHNWEARLALSKIGGVNYNQDEIGWNRICGTGDFFCMNCVIMQSQGLPAPWRLPLLPDTLLYADICELHTPICGNCIHINDVVVQCKMPNCRKLICTLCHPNGVSLVPIHRGMDPSLPEHLKAPFLHDPFTAVIGDIVGGATDMPERKKLREHLAKLGCEEVVLYDRCDICHDTVCTDCQQITAESFSSCFGSCGRKICNPCTARVCDACDRSLCGECAAYDDKQRQEIWSLISEWVSSLANPDNDNEFQECSRCMLKSKIAYLEAKGHIIPGKEQHPQLFPEDVYDEEHNLYSDSSECDELSPMDTESLNQYDWLGEYLREELPSISEVLASKPDLTFNAKLSSFVAGHTPEELKSDGTCVSGGLEAQRINKTALVKTALDKLCEQEKIRICRAIFICATLRPLLPYLQPEMWYQYELADPELPLYEQKPEGIRLIPQRINHSKYPKIIDQLQNKDTEKFIWDEYFKTSLQVQIEAWKKSQRASAEQGVPYQEPEAFSHTVTANHLLKFIYCTYNRFIIPEMRKEKFGKLDNSRALNLIRHQYIYNESLLHALKTEMPDEYIDWDFIVGPKLMQKYLDPKIGIWKINKALNVNYAKHIFKSLAWHTSCQERLSQYMCDWWFRRAMDLYGTIPSQYSQADYEAELAEKEKFQRIDRKSNPKPVFQPDDTEIACLGSVYEMLPLPGTNFSPNIMFNDYT